MLQFGIPEPAKTPGKVAATSPGVGSERKALSKTTKRGEMIRQRTKPTTF